MSSSCHRKQCQEISARAAFQCLQAEGDKPEDRYLYRYRRRASIIFKSVLDPITCHHTVNVADSSFSKNSVVCVHVAIASARTHAPLTVTQLVYKYTVTGIAAVSKFGLVFKLVLQEHCLQPKGLKKLHSCGHSEGCMESQLPIHSIEKGGCMCQCAVPNVDGGQDVGRVILPAEQVKDGSTSCDGVTVHVATVPPSKETPRHNAADCGHNASVGVDGHEGVCCGTVQPCRCNRSSNTTHVGSVSIRHEGTR